METIKIRYTEPDLIKLEKIQKGCWIDLRAAEDVMLDKGDFALISLGIAMELPVGYEAILASRSSTFKNYGLLQSNGIGVVDESYCGDDDVLMMPVFATRDTHISVNDRICQFRIFKHQPEIVFEEKDHLGTESRGGFGSTGRA